MKRSISPTLVLLAICLATATSVPGAQLRTWTDNQGNALEAALFGADAENLYLKNAEGQMISVPRAGLSEADQAWLQQQQPLPGPPTEPPSVRVNIQESRSADISRVQYLVPDGGRRGFRNAESRATASYLSLKMEVSGGSETDLDVVYFEADQTENEDWQISFRERYDLRVEPPERAILTTEPVLIDKKLVRGKLRPFISRERHEAPGKTTTSDWLTAVFWYDEQGRAYLLDVQASQREILDDDEIMTMLRTADPKRTRVNGSTDSQMRQERPRRRQNRNPPRGNNRPRRNATP